MSNARAPQRVKSGWLSKPGLLKSFLAVTATVAIAFGGSIVLATSANAAPGDPVSFADQNLADAVNERLGQAPGDLITEADAAGLTTLDAQALGVTDLSGIEYLTGLIELDLSSNNIANVSALSGLTGLTDLDLSNNNIVNVSALSGLTDLTHLDLSANNIAEVSDLSSLTDLTVLYLSFNNISDVSALSGLTELTRLQLNRNTISDIAALSNLTNLAFLNLNENAVQDLSALSALTNLTILFWDSNTVSDISTLTNLISLTTVSLSDNSISDVSALSALTALISLNLSKNDVEDISGLSSLTNLARLELRLNSVLDVSALSGLANLTNLSLEGQWQDLPSVAVGARTANPVVDVAGEAVSVSSSDPGFVYDASSHEWTFVGTSGSKDLMWSLPVTVGNAIDVEFSGTIIQAVTSAPLPVPVVLQDPEIVQAFCLDGTLVNPQIILPSTENVEYVLEGDLLPGATVTVRAAANEGHYLNIAPGSGWNIDSDRMDATLQITLDVITCVVPPASDDGVKTPAAASGSTLPATGVSQSTPLFGMLGALLILTGAALAIVRRRTA